MSNTDLLLLDDDDVFRQRLAKALTLRDFIVSQAASISEVIELLQIKQFPYAVLDLYVADGSGMTLIEPLLKSNSSMQIVILTGYGTINTAVDAVKRGAKQYLTKPTDADVIVSALKSEKLDQGPETNSPTLAQVEWEHMQKVLKDCDGNITKAAKVLGLHRRSLQRKLAKQPGKLL